jgi:hypothetical protein
MEINREKLRSVLVEMVQEAVRETLRGIAEISSGAPLLDLAPPGAGARSQQFAPRPRAGACFRVNGSAEGRNFGSWDCRQE